MAGVEASVGVLTRALAIVGVAVLVAGPGHWLVPHSARPAAAREHHGDRRAGSRKATCRSASACPTTDQRGWPTGFSFRLDARPDPGGLREPATRACAKERSERQLRHFVADASHELRTPLTTLRGYSDLYRAGGLDEEAALDQAMTRIGSESRRMAALVEDMLLLARLDQGRPLATSRCRCQHSSTTPSATLRAVEPDRPIDANVEADGRDCGDEDRLRQVVGNLFTNVRVHTAASTPIEVSSADARWALTLKSSPTTARASTRRTSRTSSTASIAPTPGRSRDRGGSGLGLSIAASVVAAHGGEIAYTNARRRRHVHRGVASRGGLGAGAAIRSATGRYARRCRRLAESRGRPRRESGRHDVIRSPDDH